MRRGLRIIVVVTLAVLVAAVGLADAQSSAPTLEERVCFLEDSMGVDNPWCDPVTPPSDPDPTTTTTVAPTTTTTVAPTTTVPPTTTTTGAPPSTSTTSSTTAPTTTSPPVSTTTSAPTTTSTTQPPSGDFVASFDTPADFYGRFDTDVHFRADDYNETATFHGDHDASCGAPTTGRTVHLDSTNNSEVFWHCAPGGDPAKGHIMTGMGPAGFGYAIVTFKPKQSFTGVDRVCVDVNATQLGGDKWWEMSVLPLTTFNANGGRMDYVTAIASGIDDTALHFPSSAFVYQINDNKIRAYQGMTERIFDWFSYSTTDRAARFTNCMTDNHNGTVTLTRKVGVTNNDAPGGVRTVTVPGSFPQGQVVVLFQDSTYDPPKHGSGPTQTTWHWDAVSIS